MRNHMFNQVYSYINWIRVSYKAIAKINASIPVLRLISEERDKKEDEVCFRIQISGKNIFPIVSVKDLNNPFMISNFSKGDQDIIRSYISDVRSRIRKRIVARTYDRETKLFKYTIEYLEPGSKVRSIIINNLALLSNEIYNFDKDDAQLIEFELKKTTLEG
ncbi:hypothetical protein ACQUW5_04800 [Legionella sp. CNM-1927-20]|uniref:hypothetical protein n=1 Tax=Legionella sp. CNM-1927-20 TaxID=3422221 RepID=UPI00403AD4DD